VNAWDPAFLEQQYASWKRDPNSVDASWRQFFLGFDHFVERCEYIRIGEISELLFEKGDGFVFAESAFDCVFIWENCLQFVKCHVALFEVGKMIIQYLEKPYT
jgi:hypothetical protein